MKKLERIDFANRQSSIQILMALKLTLLVFLLTTSQVFSQQGRITGSVSLNDGTSLAGVTVVVQGTTNGTLTDINGNYTLSNVPSNSVLVFSFVGMKTQQITYTGQASLNVTMEEEVSRLDEVVVIGYGTARKADLTGSVGVVEVEEIKKISASDIGNFVKGRVAGVIVTADGEPGNEPSVRVRGFSTFGNAQPLYVVDGIPVESGQRDINPNDIATMQVLKDASAASVYGSRAANGVIIITTKRGQKDTPLKVSYQGYYGFDKVWQIMPMLNRVDYQKTWNAACMNYNGKIYAGNDPSSPNYIDDIDTDWQSEAMKTGTRMNHSLNLSGGGSYNTYNVSLDYYNSDGTLVGLGPEYNRYSVRANNTFEKGIFSVSTSLYYAHTNENSLGSTIISSFSGAGRPPMINDIICAIPTQRVRNPDGTWGTYDITTHGQTYSLNIVAVNHDLELENLAERIIASGTAQIDFGKAMGWTNSGLKYKLNVSYDKGTNKTFNWVPAFAYSSFFTNTVAKLDENGYFNTNALIENTLEYTLNTGSHNLNVLAGQMYQEGSYNSVTAHGETFPKPYIKELSAAASTSASTYESQNYLASYLGRMNYNYADRYLLTLTMRRDGSSRFSKSNRFGYFPSAALGWRISNESFWNVPENIISSLKLRGSWGQLGNANIGEYQYMVSVNRNAYYNFSNTKIQGGAQVSVVSDNIKWETKEMTNIGLDAELFNGKIDFSAEWYKSRSDDILVRVNIPQSVGSLISNPIQNAGTLENSGLEFSLGYRNMEREFKYEVSVNAATLNNKVISLGNNGAPIYGSNSINIEGEEVGQHFGYVYDGIFQNQAEVNNHAFQTIKTAPGDIRFKDISGPDGVPDGQITSLDRTTLGSAIPKLTYGINFSASYKNWDMSLFMNGALGFLINDNIYMMSMHTSGGLNWRKEILDFWTPTNTDTEIPRVIDTDPNNNARMSDRPGWLQKGDYLKFANLTIGYNLPQELTRKISINNARLYVTAQNFYILTKYKGYNPDFTGSITSPGYNFGSYPTPRTIILGVNFDF